ncbi:MAG: 30S ribosomal protein S20 [Tissierellia bacterium]|nr:30S ribosomal protein S20 [Bacillota bacterium]NLL23696.1 30S ribosomal protein S20 [Tissierellia bacterium]
MANIKSAKKRILVINKKTERNKAAKSRMKTSVRRFNEALATNERELAEQKFIDAQKIVQKTASKGSIHRNTARRKVARMAKALNKLA